MIDLAGEQGVLLLYGLTLAAVVAALLAVRKPVGPGPQPTREGAPNRAPTWLAVGLIVALGLLLRISHTEQAPPAVYVDEAANGNDALRALASGRFAWFYPGNSGREGLFINLVALCFAWIGPGILSLRLPAILASTLTIFGVFLLFGEMFNRRTGLLAAYLTAVSFWPVAMGRLGLRANLLPMVLVFSFWMLLRGLKTRRLLWFALAGVVFGIGLHTYIAWRAAPLVLVVAGAAMAARTRSLFRTHWRPMLVFVGASLIVAAPMIVTFARHPDYLLFRTQTASIFSAELNHGSPLRAFIRSLFFSLAKYNVWGDPSFRRHLPPYPLLDPLSAALFLSGLLMTAARLVAWLRSRAGSPPDASLFLLVWFFGMLAPEFLSAEDVPHSLRAIGTLPVVLAFAALPLDWAFAQASLRSSRARRALLATIAASLAVVGVLNPGMYFLVWAKRRETALAFDKRLTDVSNYLSTAPVCETFIIVGRDSLATLPIKVFHPEATNTFLYEDEADRIAPKDRRRFMVILLKRNPAVMRTLQDGFPGLTLTERRSDPGSRFFVMTPGD